MFCVRHIEYIYQLGGNSGELRPVDMPLGKLAGFGREYPQVRLWELSLDWSRQTLDPYRDCPKQKCLDAGVRAVGAVSIGSFELSRWRGGRGGAMGFRFVRAGCGPVYMEPTKTKNAIRLFSRVSGEP